MKLVAAHPVRQRLNAQQGSHAMFGALIMTLALVGGECPTCDVTSAPHGRGLVYPKPKYAAPEHCLVGCQGQDCFSCTRPLYPGAIPFDYRREFNYPWSQDPVNPFPKQCPAGVRIEPGIQPFAYTPSCPTCPSEFGPMAPVPEEIPVAQGRRKVKATTSEPTQKTTVIHSPSAPRAAKREVLRWELR